jgi:hypothetical protein
LLDTNAIIEAWRAGGWKALADGHRLETVETVVMETHAGFQRRPSSPPSPIAHRPIDLQLPIACGGVGVYPSDIVVGDRDSADFDLETALA